MYDIYYLTIILLLIHTSFVNKWEGSLLNLFHVVFNFLSQQEYSTYDKKSVDSHS